MPQIFNTWEWLAPWWHAYGTDRELMVLRFLKALPVWSDWRPLDNHETIRLSVRYRLLGLLGDGSGDSDNLDFPPSPDTKKSVVRSFMDFLEQDRSPGIAAAEHPSRCSPVLSHLLEELGDRGWPDAITLAPLAIALPADWDSLPQPDSKNERRKLLYYSRRVARRFSAEFHKCSERAIGVCLDASLNCTQTWQRLANPAPSLCRASPVL